jgi:putative DeoR family transcriptional regulator (stage III sporulation protein D)
MVNYDLTIREIAQRNGYSKSTVFNDLENRLPQIDLRLYRQVRHILDYHKSVRHLRGGESTSRKYQILRKEG